MTEGEALPEVEERVGDMGVAMDSDGLGELEEDARVRLVGVVKVSEVLWSEVLSVCEGLGVGVVSLGEVGIELGEEGTDAVEGMGGGELSTGEVMRGIGEDG